MNLVGPEKNSPSTSKGEPERRGSILVGSENLSSAKRYTSLRCATSESARRLSAEEESRISPTYLSTYWPLCMRTGERTPKMFR